jgi:SulP family sulfate permease
MYRLGWDQFIPFMTTVIAIVLTDLLKGILIGLAVAVFYLLRNHYKNAYSLEHQPEMSNGRPWFRMLLAEEVSFLNKGSIMKTLNKLPEGSTVEIDGSNSKVIDHDVIEVIQDFIVNAKRRNIQVKVLGIPPIKSPSRNHAAVEQVAR